MSAVAELERVAEGLPDGWSPVRLDQIAELCLGKMLDKEKNRGEPRPYLANMNVRWGSFDLQDLREMPFEERELDRYGLRYGDIVMCEGGEPGRCAIWTDEVPGMMIQKALHRIRPRKGTDSHYLYYALAHGVRSGSFDELMTGSGIKHLPGNQVAILEVLAPPLDEQRRIAEVLRSVDEAIAANQAVAVQARRTYQAALTELVGSGLDHWETVCLGQIATFVNGRGFKPHEWGDEGYPIIRIQNLNGGTDFNYYSGDFNPKILVRPGDLLFAWSGSRGTSFGPHIWRGPEGVLNYHTWKVVPAAPEDRDYLYFALRHLTKKIEDEAHGASALVHMQKAYVVDYEIQLPPPEERNAIAATLIDLQEAANNADQVYREARAMKGHLMSDLLSGRVRVPENRKTL